MIKCGMKMSASVFISLSLAFLTAHASELQCKLDPKVNIGDFSEYAKKDEFGNLFAGACGRNRGIFVTEPADGHTYSCAKFPESWNLTDVNAIKHDNAEHGIKILNEFIKSVYLTTPEYIRKKDPGACDFETMSVYECGKEKPWEVAPWVTRLHSPIRGVNTAGLFVLQRWVTPGLLDWDGAGITGDRSFKEQCEKYQICGLLAHHWDTFYTQEDFLSMHRLGLNSVRIPLGWWFFAEDEGVTDYVIPDKKHTDSSHPLTTILSYANEAGLQVILSLNMGSNKKSGVSEESKSESHPVHRLHTVGHNLAKYVSHISKSYGLHNVMLLELELGEDEQSEDMESALVKAFIGGVRKELSDMPILLPETVHTTPSDAHIYLDTKIYHGATVPDLASDSEKGDREKMYAHMKIACGYQAPLHFTTCTRVPTLVGEFSIAIENCLPYVDADFQDYGQCSNLEGRAASPWWKRSIRSFADRQVSTYEKELGWIFQTYKLDDTAETPGYSESTVYWSFRLAAQAGIFDLSQPTDKGCLFHPPADFEWGDGNPPDWWWALQASMSPISTTGGALPLLMLVTVIATAGLVMGVMLLRKHRMHSFVPVSSTGYQSIAHTTSEKSLPLQTVQSSINGV